MPAPETAAPDLAVAGLRVEAGGRTILDIPALTVPAGAMLVLRGASGAGKSTALNVLSGNLAASAGQVRWGGTDIAGLSPAGRRRFRRERLGLIFQDYRLFAELGALDNAALAAAWMPRARRPALRAAAGQPIPAVMVTAQRNPQIARDCAAIGAVLVEKPVCPEELGAVLSRTLSRTRA